MFKYAPNLEAYMRSADVIISHAGSGSLFEAMRMGKPLIAVPNSILMHNHQAELVSPWTFSVGRIIFHKLPLYSEAVHTLTTFKMHPEVEKDSRSHIKVVCDNPQND